MGVLFRNFAREAAEKSKRAYIYVRRFVRDRFYDNEKYSISK